MSMLNAVIISGMSIVSFIIKHTHFSGRNVMLRSVSDRIDGGSPGVCVWEIGQVLPGLCFFPLGNPSVVQTWAEKPSKSRITHSEINGKNETIVGLSSRKMNC